MFSQRKRGLFKQTAYFLLGRLSGIFHRCIGFIRSIRCRVGNTLLYIFYSLTGLCGHSPFHGINRGCAGSAE